MDHAGVCARPGIGHVRSRSVAFGRSRSNATFAVMTVEMVAMVARLASVFH
ncbi:hypothetical protein AKJ09_03794 [Labilithrix luteola]|uniref:Uncharacterized protein n=1 Tax=Labilithrix luteola TaxID=1391654 RepID=A0A0K1PUB6_9BACT|nr:hypothetical protein AKJ09_03794 [Labilithrix luteola]